MPTAHTHLSRRGATYRWRLLDGTATEEDRRMKEKAIANGEFDELPEHKIERWGALVEGRLVDDEVRRLVDDALVRHGLAMKPGSQTYRQVALDAASSRRTRSTSSPARSRRSRRNSSPSTSGTAARKTERDWRMALRYFVGLVGDLRIGDVTEKEVNRFRERLINVPAEYGKGAFGRIDPAKAAKLRSLTDAVKAARAAGEATDLHSFRATFAQALRRACVPLDQIKPLTGHQETDVTVVHYALAFSPRRKKKVIEKLRSGVDLSHLHGRMPELLKHLDAAERSAPRRRRVAHPAREIPSRLTAPEPTNPRPPRVKFTPWRTGMEFQYDDGGRAAAGFRGRTRDCVCRAIAIATGKPYREVYDALNALAATERLGKRRRRRSSTRTGVHNRTSRRYMASISGPGELSRSSPGSRRPGHEGQQPDGSRRDRGGNRSASGSFSWQARGFPPGHSLPMPATGHGSALRHLGPYAPVPGGSPAAGLRCCRNRSTSEAREAGTGGRLTIIPNMSMAQPPPGCACLSRRRARPAYDLRSTGQGVFPC